MGLPIPDTPTKFTCQINTSSLLDLPPLTVEVSAPESEDDSISTISALSGTKIQWENRIKSRVTHLTGGPKFIVVGTLNGEIYFFSLAGRQIIPCLVVGDPIAALESNGDFLVSVSCGGTLHIWNVPLQKCILNTSILSLVDSGDINITRVRISKSGKPLLTFSNHFSFAYHFDMQVWARVADDKYFLSEFSSSLQFLAKGGPKGSLAEIQLMTNLAHGALGSNVDQKLMETIAHLESQVASALLLESQDEYKYWLQTYVTRLTKESLEAKLHEICNFLLGPVSKQTSWDPFILNFSKRDLLNEFLPIISSNRSLQRLVTQFKEALDTIKE